MTGWRSGATGCRAKGKPAGSLIGMVRKEGERLPKRSDVVVYLRRGEEKVRVVMVRE